MNILTRFLNRRNIRTAKNVIKWLDALPNYDKCNGEWHDGSGSHCAMGVAQVTLKTPTQRSTADAIGLRGVMGEFHDKNDVFGMPGIAYLNDGPFVMDRDFTNLRSVVIQNLDRIFSPGVAKLLKCYYTEKQEL